MVIFNHIPKTAGASFRTLLRKQYASSFYEIRDNNLSSDIKTFLSFDVETQNSFKIILGHCSQYCGHNILSKKTIVFLRDPFHQMMSVYYQIRKNPNNMWHQVSKKCTSVMEVADFMEAYGLNNIQTRFLASKKDLVKLLETKGSVMGPIDNSEFELALKNLKQINFIGLTEQFDKSILHFKKELGWSTPYYIKSNKTVSNIKLSFREEEIRKVRKVQFFDEKIYLEAVKLFEKSICNSDINNTDIIRFRIKNFCYNNLIKARNKI